MTNTQHIYFCADNKYVPFATVTMASILANADKNTPIYFHIIGDDISEQTEQKVNQLKNIRSVDIDFIKISQDIFKDFKMDMGYLSQAAFYRFLIPSLAPLDADKVLYLDGDMIVTGPLNELFAQDLDGFKAGVVEEKGAFQVQNLSLKSGRYFNSGMMLLNLKEINKDTLLSEALEYFKTHKTQMVCHDQDILNGLWDERVKFLEQKYNVPSFVKKEKNPLIIHYTGFMKKPWAYFSRHPQKRLWLKYLQLTAFRKTGWEMFWFKFKELLSRAFLFVKDPTHKKYYIVHFFGIRFGLGSKDDKRR